MKKKNPVPPSDRDRRYYRLLRRDAAAERKSGAPQYPPPGLVPWLMDQIDRLRPDLAADADAGDGKRG